MDEVIFDVEHTDTYGRNANYCWVTRKKLTLPAGATNHQITIAAKAALGMTGVRCDREEHGETIVLWPRGICQVIFITPRY